MGWTINNSYIVKSKSAYPIAAFHIEISSEGLETLRIFETFRQYFMLPKAGEKQQEKQRSGKTITSSYKYSTKIGKQSGLSDTNNIRMPFP